MGSVLTSDEIKALTEKLNNPCADVVCPRCGESLTFNTVGNSCEVMCPTGCIYDCIRGL